MPSKDKKCYIIANAPMDEKINNNLVIDRTLVSRLTALTVVAGLFLFVAGYFLGKKQGVHEFLKTFEHESFADQIYTAMHIMYPPESFLNDAISEESVEIVESAQSGVLLTSQAGNNTVNSNATSVEQEKGYYANVIGFRTRKAAEHFKERLRKKGIDLIIKERQSATLKGKKIIWFQVSTHVYADTLALADVIEHIKKVENIKEISMRTI